MTVVMVNDKPGSDREAAGMAVASSAPRALAISPASRGGQSEADGVAIARSRAVRWWLTGVGLVCVAIGGLGVVVPGLPTTIFLLIASWCFVRSCPVLERVLIRNRFFAPFVRYLQPGTVMPTRARVVSTSAIWIAIAVTVYLFTARGTPAFVIGIVIAAGAVGTIAVWCVARPMGSKSKPRDHLGDRA